MVGPGEDEWKDETDLSLRYSIRLLIKHPNIDPARITETLGLKPKSTRLVGMPRTTPRGDPLPGTYKESTWSHRFRTERNRYFFRDVVHLLDRLEPHKDFLHQLVAGGGTIELIVHLPGDTNIGDTFRWRDMARLGALRIDLGIEVFPNSISRGTDRQLRSR